MLVYDTDSNEISNIVSMLKTSSSKGFDDIASKIVKSMIDEILCPLTTIFNISLQRGEFPDQLKIAKLVPIYKSDDKQLVNNYRPISILPFFPKILEKLMYNRLLNYINDNKVLVDNQYGFREGHIWLCLEWLTIYLKDWMTKTTCFEYSLACPSPLIPLIINS